MRGSSFLTTVVALLACGCIKQIAYSPNESLVQSLGVDKARQDLEIVLARSVEPKVTSSEVTDDYLDYRWTQTALGPFYQTISSTVEARIYFENLSRIEVYENHNVFLWAPGDSRVDKVRFAN